MSSSADPTSASGAVPQERSCNKYRLLTDADLSFKQRACYYEQDMIAPQLALRAAFMTGFAQLRNTEKLDRNPSTFPQRFGDYYARHAARDAGEFMVGYLHHEDPRYHPSRQHSFVKRTGSALLSVLLTKDTEGNTELALAPMAGSLSSGMVSTLVTTRRNPTIEGGLQRAGFVYTTYFIKAVYNEYKPEMSGFIRGLLHRQ